jgi:YfiH family protein
MAVRGTRLDETPQDGQLPRYELTSWARDYGVVSGITGRGDAFNLGLLTPEPAARVTARWQLLFSTFRPGFGSFVMGLQCHGTRVAVHQEPPAGWLVQDGVDGHATWTPGVLLTVTVADCIPVYLLHPATKTVALLHAGWRGIAAGMLEQGISTMVELAGGVSTDLVIHCGVGICGRCYEVDSEVTTALKTKALPNGGVDLRSVLAARAAEVGVGQFSQSGWCTAHDHDRFFSHRRSGGTDGRMLAYLGVPRA